MDALNISYTALTCNNIFTIIYLFQYKDGIVLLPCIFQTTLTNSLNMPILRFELQIKGS